MRKINKVVRVALSGGFLGSLTTNPRRALDNALEQANADGWNCHQILPHKTSNTFIDALQGFITFCTLGLWTFEAGYLLLLEKEVTDDEVRSGWALPFMRRGGGRD